MDYRYLTFVLTETGAVETSIATNHMIYAMEDCDQQLTNDDVVSAGIIDNNCGEVIAQFPQ